MPTLPNTPGTLSDALPPMRRLRGLMAERRITTTQLAAMSGLNRSYLSHLLTERRTPGELAKVKLARAIVALGLDSEADYAI